MVGCDFQVCSFAIVVPQPGFSSEFANTLVARVLLAIRGQGDGNFSEPEPITAHLVSQIVTEVGDKIGEVPTRA